MKQMFDDTLPFDVHAITTPVTMQRTKGAARCGFKLRGTKTVLETLYQSGSFKVRLPNVAAGTAPEAVLLNTAGGLTGGDRLSFEGDVAEGAQAIFTTQASERAYRSLGSDAVVDTRLSAGADSELAWLPQETILFDGSRLKRSFDVALAGNAKLLAHETIVFGRTAMGETVHQGAFSDFWRVYRDGRLIHADALRADGNLDEILSLAATLQGAKAMSTVFYAGDDALTHLQAVRDLIDGLSPAKGVAGVSAWSGKLLFRAIATGSAAARHMVEPVIRQLRNGKPLPRVWAT
jgi:urease accessory protein